MAWLLVVAELLGLVGALRLGWLAAALWASAAVPLLTLRPRIGRVGRVAGRAEPTRADEPAVR